MLKPRQLVTVLTLGLIVGSLFFVFSPEVARSQTTTPTPRGLELVGTALMEASESPLAGVSVHGNYAFVGGTSAGYTSPFPNVGVRIVDLSDPSNPELVGRIPLRSRGPYEDHTHGDAVATHLATTAFEGDVALVLNGVPDTFSPGAYPQPYGIWDVTDPSNPAFLSVVNLGPNLGRTNPHDGSGELGDKPLDSKAVAGSYFYTLYHEFDTRVSSRFAAVDISDPRNPVVVGDWQGDPDAGLLGLSLNEAGTRAYLTGVYPYPWGFSATHGYVYILDLQDPSQPTEIGRYIFPLRGVISSMSKAAPNSDDSLLVLVDHSWQSGALGIVHILDTSDLTAIHEISAFALPESDGPLLTENFPIATDVALKGNLIFSTWLNEGLRVIDISDPRRPVQVGEFLSPRIGAPWLSDVALKDDLVVATSVWSSGLYILRQTAEAPTVVIDETTSMRVSAAGSGVLPGFHVSWEWPDGTREAAWNGFLNVGGIDALIGESADFEIGDDGWVYVPIRHRYPYTAEKVELAVNGVYSWGVSSFVIEADRPHVIFDRVQVYLTAPERMDMGSSISWSGFYEYDGQPFLGGVTFSRESDQVGTFLQTVQAISDPLYGLEAFAANEVEVTFDRVDITLEMKTPEVAVGGSAEISTVARYASDNTPFEGTIILSKDLIQLEEGTYSYTVVSIEDTAYGLTVFSSNTVEVTFFVPPFYAQPSFLVVLLAFASAAGVAVFLLRRRRRRLKGAEARVDRVRL